HLVEFQSKDRVDHLEVLASTIVFLDQTPPVTNISYSGAYWVQTGSGTPSQAQVFIASMTYVVLTAQDPVAGGVASGMQATRYRVDSGTWTDYAGSFLLPGEGQHAVEWTSTDRASNEEAVQSLNAAVDSVTPETGYSIGQPSFGTFGMRIIDPEALISFNAEDSAAAGAASGVEETTYRIDAGSPQVFSSSFTLSLGTHSVEYWSADHVGNEEAHDAFAVTVTQLRPAAMGVNGFEGSGSARVVGDALSNGLVDLKGSFVLEGDVTASSVSLKGGSSVTGVVTQGQTPLLAEPISLAEAKALAEATSSNYLIPPEFLAGGVLVVDASTLTLSSGTYIVQGLQVSNNGVLKTTQTGEGIGAVQIFVEGAISVGSGGKLNDQGHPLELVVFSSSTLSVQFSSGAVANGVFYAPRAHIEAGNNAQVGGALFGKTIKIGGQAVVTAVENVPMGQSSSASASATTESVSEPAALDSSGADPSFELRDIYVFPNPAVAGAPPAIHAAVGIADRVRFVIYNMAGQKVHEATMDGIPPVIDDGTGPKYAYEYTWRGHIPSGVYLYTIEAEKAGYASLRAAGKMGVIR
ncbi:MAG: hypothetical protein HY611_09950, partial [Elusimicrobia bacterium]|nr:hypothetical protein [Elusimicrobiota bacterium]